MEAQREGEQPEFTGPEHIKDKGERNEELAEQSKPKQNRK